MLSRRRLLTCVLILYCIGLVWGYVRLPWAAVKSLADYGLIASAPAVSFAASLDVSPAQRWYLEHALTESPIPVVPRVSVDVDHGRVSGPDSRDLCRVTMSAWTAR